jgi:hypothetical protein
MFYPKICHFLIGSGTPLILYHFILIKAAKEDVRPKKCQWRFFLRFSFVQTKNIKLFKL